MSNSPDLDKLQRKLNYHFNDESWLILALTHRSKSKTNYERLEFLGDSFLGFIVSDYLYKNFPREPEGILTRLRANVVRQKSLAAVAREFELNDFLILGAGEGKSGGHNRDSTLSDVLEAIIAAIYLDGGAQEARGFVETTFAQVLNDLDPSAQLKDSKSTLQEWLQKRGYDVPNYEVVNITGKDHKQSFEVECQVAEVNKNFKGKGKGSSRRRAEQKSAQRTLDYLKAIDCEKESDSKSE